MATNDNLLHTDEKMEKANASCWEGAHTGDGLSYVTIFSIRLPSCLENPFINKCISALQGCEIYREGMNTVFCHLFRGVFNVHGGNISQEARRDKIICTSLNFNLMTFITLIILNYNN